MGEASHLSSVASCLWWKGIWPAGYFSSGQGGVITMADATEFSPMGALDIAGLRDGFRGELLRPQDSGYEDARRVERVDYSFPGPHRARRRRGRRHRGR